MKTILLTTLLAASTAQAMNFSPSVDGTHVCAGNTTCYGYLTDTADTVDYINISSGRITLSINGQTYSGISPGSGQQFQAGDKLVTLIWTSRRTCTGSGRGQHCQSWLYANSGSVQ